MSHRDERLFYRRCFLNDEEGAAMVEARLHDNSWTERPSGETRLNFDGTLHITDCSRSIELDCSFSDVEGARGNLRKLDRLIDAVQGLRDATARAAKREFPGRKL
jgi:hypothetical protein